MPADINWEIRVLRTFRRYGSMRYRELLHRLGDPTRTSGAATRLERAGYLASDTRRLSLTPAGRAALDRFDDPTTRQKVLTELLYGAGDDDGDGASDADDRASPPEP